ncbi:MAG: alternative ribosome rescue aminoacyl-tRNA hydrolase ArfB, partial [Terriglobia bacterium]
FARASGPGGQNVNKVATAAELRFDVVRSRSLPEAVKARLMRLAGRRITAAGELVIFAQRFRTQERNRADAVQRLADLISRAAEIPKPRKPTRPTRASKRRRLDGKRRQSNKKRLRHTSGED